MRIVVRILLAVIALPASAQVSIGPDGINAGGVRIDGSGVHSGNASVTGNGVRAASQGRGTTINGNDGTRTIRCGGGGLTVNGNRNHVTASGCSQITVAGNGNELRWHDERRRTSISDVGHGNRIVRF